MADRDDFWTRLDPRYRLILCDVWGVIHDGFKLFPHVVERLNQWRSDGRFVLLITNAPRPADAVAQQLHHLGLPPGSWDAIVTSGEAGIAALNRLDRPVGFLGTRDDRAILEGRGVRFADGEAFTDLACTGLDETRSRVDDYRAQLERWAARDIRFHCLNPDRVVVHGGVTELCAGALADAYEAIGGVVSWYGKPFEEIYAHALNIAGEPARDAVLVIGDGLLTDMAGAKLMGFDAVFITGGINAGEAVSKKFDGSGWSAVATVASL